VEGDGENRIAISGLVYVTYSPTTIEVEGVKLENAAKGFVKWGAQLKRVI